MTVNILVVCGSPIKKGNCEIFTREALKGLEETPDLKVELILLSEWKSLKGCNHCNYCATKQKPNRFCSIDDEMTQIYPKLLEADALILSSPCYVTRVTGLMANFMDRLRPLYHGKCYVGSLYNKIGAAIAVAFGRHAGVETTQLSIVQAFLLWGMIPASLGLWGPYGAAGLSSYGGAGKVDPDDKLAVLKDTFGLKESKLLCKEVAIKAKIIKTGNAALNIQNKYLKMYKEAIRATSQ